MMMRWALDESDRLDYDIYVEANHQGAYLYQRFGFSSTGEVFNPKKPGADEEWQVIEK